MHTLTLLPATLLTALLLCFACKERQDSSAQASIEVSQIEVQQLAELFDKATDFGYGTTVIKSSNATFQQVWRCDIFFKAPSGWKKNDEPGYYVFEKQGTDWQKMPADTRYRQDIHKEHGKIYPGIGLVFLKGLTGKDIDLRNPDLLEPLSYAEYYRHTSSSGRSVLIAEYSASYSHATPVKSQLEIKYRKPLKTDWGVDGYLKCKVAD